MAKIGYVQIIRKCNQKCILCSNPENGREIIITEAKNKISNLKKEGHNEVILTGGEPTLHPKLEELIKYAIKTKIYPRVITNGQKTSDIKYLKKLHKAGLRHLHLSIFSNNAKIQAKLSRKKDSLLNIEKTLKNTAEVGMNINLNVVINKYNSDHLSRLIGWVVKKYPHVDHFVFNNLDPFMNRVSENPEVVPSFNDFELELHEALEILEKNRKSFRVERVPLCYMTDFEYCSTETRKIIKRENRAIYFLDDRKKVFQDHWEHQKSAICGECFLEEICAGIDSRGNFYKEEELYPVFIDKKMIINKVLKEK